MKAKKCCHCSKEIVGEPFKEFTRETYYHNYHRTHVKKTYWHEHCWYEVEKINEQVREDSLKELRELAKKLGVEITV